ncbi:MAG: CDP-glycerol glycerophosphotransferase family protein, partial [Microbacteriaceae bacterium]
GIPWKHLGKKVTSEPFAYGNIARNMLNASHVIAPDQHTLDALLSDQNVGRLVSPANTKITGYPRTDLTLNITKNRQEEIRRLLGVRPDQQVVLYAPTWRGNVDDISEDLSFFNETVLQLQRSDVFLAIRAHHFMEAQFQSHTGLPGTVVPSSVNSNELLGIVDVLVTDYSSIMFDFLPTGRPLIKYIPDFEDYQSTRGMYFTPEEVPGTTVTEAHNLASALNQALLDGESKEHHEAFRTFFTHEDGQASARVWEFLLAPLPLASEEHTNKALFFTNSFNPNGITRSLANAVRYLSTTEITPFIAIPHSAVEYADEALLQEVASHSTILLLHGGYSGTQLQNWVRGHLLQGKAQPNTRMQTIIAEGAAYEVRRRFGESRFNTAIDFDGYSPQLTMFVAGQKPALADRNLHWLHSMMLEEQQLKFPWLAAAFPWYGNFDALVSVSEGAMFQNSKELAAAFNVPQEGHITVENLLVPQRVLALSKEPLSTTASAWLKGDERTVLTVGRFAPEKNQDSLVEAIALIKDELEGLKFGFVGEGPQEAYIRKKVKDLGLEDIITFLGYEKNPYPLMSSVDLVLQASLHEGQGLALLEALTLNIPVYASDIPPFRSVLEDGVYGHLFDPSPEGIAEALRKFASGEQHQVKPFDANQYEYSAQEKLLRVLSSAAPSEERS